MVEFVFIVLIYLVVWVVIGGCGKLYGVVIGVVFVLLLFSWFIGGCVLVIDFGFYMINWVDWW